MVAGRFKALFSGYEKAHGRYTIGRQTREGKVVGQALTLPTPPTLDLYDKHLRGEYGLGIIPLTTSNTCWFAAIDVDTKDEHGNPRKIDAVAVARRVSELNLPFVVCVTKSKGVHLYVFFQNEEDAEDVRTYMEWTAALLGYGQCEIFPKQTSRDGDEDFGNWINLPYFGNQRRAVLPDGRELSLAEFITYAEGKSFSLPDALGAQDHQTEDDGSLFWEGPPCLVHIHSTGGFPSGTRNDGMYDVGVYLKKRYGDEWQQHLARYNVLLCDPPLPTREIATLEKSLGRKDYQFRCKQPPIAAHCNRRACLKRRFGVGQTNLDRDITDLTFYRTEGSYDTVYVGCEIGGRRITVEADDFYSLAKLNRICWSRFGFTVSSMPQNRWQQLIDRIGREADVVTLPPEVGESGYLWVHVQEFLNQKARARKIDEVILGKPFVEGERIWFRISDLIDWLRTRHVEFGSPQRLAGFLREKGGTDKVRRVGRATARLWGMAHQEENHVEEEQEVRDEVF